MEHSSPHIVTAHRSAELKPASKMISLRIVLAILASLLVVAQALPTAPAGNLQHRPVRSADDLKSSASYGYGYGYGYPYGGYGGYGGWGGYGGYGGWGGYGYGYPYGGGYHGYGYGYPYGGGWGGWWH